MLYSKNILPGKTSRHRASHKIMERSWIDPFSYHGIQGHGTRAIAKIFKFNLFTLKKIWSDKLRTGLGNPDSVRVVKIS